jgi:hypothetical protein
MFQSSTQNSHVVIFLKMYLLAAVLKQSFSLSMGNLCSIPASYVTCGPSSLSDVSALSVSLAANKICVEKRGVQVYFIGSYSKLDMDSFFYDIIFPAL